MELENQISLVRNQMLLDGYSHSGINCYNYSWNRLKELAKVYDHSAYSDELGTSFIKTMQLEDDDYDIPKRSKKDKLREIREAKERLDSSVPTYKRFLEEDDE